MRIALFLRLTRKDINNIIDYPFPPEFSPKFKKFCRHYTKLEHEFEKGITDHNSWGTTMLTWATALTESAMLV